MLDSSCGTDSLESGGTSGVILDEIGRNRLPDRLSDEDSSAEGVVSVGGDA